MTDRPLPASSLACPLPHVDDQCIAIAHGGGGRLSRELVEELFVPAFANPTLSRLGDAAVLAPLGTRLAFTTDAFVVQPLFFPGGSIGELAVHGTINDLAMSGAQPLALSAAFILEEGLTIETLRTIVARMAHAAAAAGVPIVTGDTKVVERGRGDGCYIATTGLGAVPADVDLGPEQCRPGDVVLVSGPLGNHGMAVMSVREGLAFATEITSDTAALHELTAALLHAAPGARFLRDPTRGGAAATLNELAVASRCGVLLDEQALPIDPPVQAACEMLGLDPLLVANEGKLIAVVPPEQGAVALAALREHPLGRGAVQIGVITADRPGKVVLRTPLGTHRLLPLPLGEQLPRIC